MGSGESVEGLALVGSMDSSPSNTGNQIPGIQMHEVVNAVVV